MVTLQIRERSYICMVSLQKAVCGRPLNPIEKLRVIGTIGFACWRCAGDSIVHPANAGDHSLGRAAGAVDRNHGGKSCPPQSLNRIDAEGGVLPHTGTHARLCEFHYDSGDAADEKRERVLEHTPRY